MNLIKSSMITISGIVTSILTALAVVLIYKLTGFNIFTFSFWVVIPIGAVLTGFFAASGYAFGSILTNSRPTAILILHMAVVAAGTYFFIYYLEYLSQIVDGKKLSEMISFSEYLKGIFENAQISLAKKPRRGVGVGSFGYILALIDFLGFILGGILIYFYLTTKKMCDTCSKYLKDLGFVEKFFPSTKEYQNFVSQSSSLSPSSLEYLKQFEREGTPRYEMDSKQIAVTLYHCPGCKKQYTEEIVHTWDGNDWEEVEGSTKLTTVPEGQNLIPTFSK